MHKTVTVALLALALSVGWAQVANDAPQTHDPWLHSGLGSGQKMCLRNRERQAANL